MPQDAKVAEGIPVEKVETNGIRHRASQLREWRSIHVW